MGKIAIYGAGQAGRMVLKWLPVHQEAVCFLDGDPAKHNTVFEGLPVRAPQSLSEAEWAELTGVVIAVMKREAATEITGLLRGLGFQNQITEITTFRDLQDVRAAVLRLYAEQIRSRNIPGAAAELGVYRGDFAQEINRFLPDRPLILFDTFEGFDAADVAAEDARTAADPHRGGMDFSGTDMESVRERLPHPEQAVFVPGRFPESLQAAPALPEQYALVSLDVDLYEPTRQGLAWFWPRLAEGGVILVHDYTGTQYPGVKRAVDEFCQRQGIHLLPLPDLHGTAVLMRQNAAGRRSVRRIVMMRHGEREHSHEVRYVGRTDDPLTEHGAWQAYQSGKWLSEHLPGIGHIYSSPIPRCARTAREAGRAMGFEPDEIVLIPDLQEVDLGEWEYRTRQEMMEIEPEKVAARESHLGSFIFPGGESFLAGGARLMNAVHALREQTEGDFLVVTHAGVLRGFLALLNQVDADRHMEHMPPLAGMIILEDEGPGTPMKLVRESFAPEERLDDAAELERLYRKYETPETVIRHMRKTAETVKDILKTIDYNGDMVQPVRAALLHDLLRTRPDHENASADALIKEGYRELARIVRQHNDENIPTDQEELTAAELLYLADKLTDGDRRVTLEERFEKSRGRCSTPEALAHHQARYLKALTIQDKIQRKTNCERYEAGNHQ